MVVASQLIAKVSTEGVDSAKSQLQDMGSTVNNTGGIFKNALGGALSFAAGLAGQAFGFLKDQVTDGIGLAIQHQAIMQQTAQAIKSTGDASGMTAQQIADLADKQQNLTGINKDTIQQAENLELTFTGISGDVFPQVTQAALDMSTAMHEDLSSAMMQVAEATNSPKDGLAKLTREGVTFSDQEKKMITDMQNAGDTAGAQKIMLGELQKEFGGSADAAGKTFGGQLTILKDRLNDVKEHIGEALMPVLQGLTGFISSNILPVLDNFGNWFSSEIPKIDGYFKPLQQPISIIGQNVHDLLIPAFQNLGNIFQQIFAGNTISGAGLLKDAVSGIGQIVRPVAGWMADFYNATDSLQHSSFVPTVREAWTILKSFAPDLQNIAGLLAGQFKQGLQFASESAKQLGDWFRTSVAPALKDALPGFLQLAHVLLENVVPAAIQIRGVIMEVVEHALKTFGPILGEIIPPLIRFAGILAKDVAEGLKFIMPYVIQAAKAIGQFAEEIMDRVAPIVEGWIKNLTPLVQGFMSWWTANWPIISEVLKGVWDEIVGIVKIAWSLVSGIILIGLDLISGNWKQAWTDLQNMLGGIWDGIKQFIKGGIENAKADMMAVEDIVNTYLVKPFQNALGTIGGVFNNIGKLVSDVTSANWGAIPGDAHALGFAGGTPFAPGGFAMVGEQGPELAYVPRGTQIWSASQTQQMMSSSGAGGAGTPIILVLDGHAVARGLWPYQISSIRSSVGVRF